ncbi:site-specific integrase [Streptomyces sp. XD-27]|uniref:site-specific integrase n=1 Tax=Streptomyces sp. XD-27 TaxID=3062779 RepID=UPI0026F431A8|nr:site-specific integrase [Streptomyces sp. XD-27]WKX70068.1 site-specific integrase [Streptomyces sp. XD-27]
MKKRKDPVTKKRERTELWGSKTKRYRVCGIPGVRKRSFDNLEDAKTWLKSASTDQSRGSHVDPRDGDVTLQWYVEKKWWPTLRVPPTTKETMRPRVFKHILPHVGHLSLNRIGSDEIKEWQTRAEEDIDVGTLRTTWRHFASIMQAAFKAKRIPANPFRDEDLQPPTAPKSKAKAWTRARVAAVRKALDRRYRILVDEAVGAGVRQGEAFGLSPDDLDGDVIHVARQVIKVGGRLAFAPPKGNKERDAPCPPELAESVKAYMKEFEPVEVTLPWVDPDRPNMRWEDRPLVTVRLLVTTPRGNAINRSTFDEKQWKPALVEAGVIASPIVTVTPRPGKPSLRRVKWNMPREDGFHVLRHTFASIVLAAGETIQQLADWLGHSDPAFTYRTYVHFLPESGHRALEVLGTWITGGTSAPAAKAPSAGDSQQDVSVIIAALAEITAGADVPGPLRERLTAVLSTAA